jgi:branched-chain amino acid transport system ATP-binding protein
MKLRLENVTTGYTKAPILHDVSLEVEQQFVGVLGANGAGKTTMLRTICGELKPWSGTIELAGRPAGRMSTWKRVSMGVVHVPEGRHVFGGMTVRENLDVAGLAGRDAARRRERVLELFPRLAERQKQLAGSMSGGEQQMLAIGRALMCDPRLLLIDEMTAGLAPVIAQHLVEALVQIHREGIGIIVVEQSPLLIGDAVERLYLMEGGRIVGAGSLEQLGGPDALAERYLGVHAHA